MKRSLPRLAALLLTAALLPACERNAQIDLLLPATPGGLGTTAGNMVLQIDWTAAAGAKDYEIQRSSGGSPFATIATTSGTTFVDSGLTNGTTYTYRIRSTNAVAASPFSATTSGVPVNAPPAVPTGLAALPGDTTVFLDWDDMLGATSYEVRSGPTGSATTLIATVTSSDHIDTGLTNGTEVCYVVRALNVAGASLDSAEVCATPGPPPVPTGVTAVAAGTSITVNWALSAGAASYNIYRADDGIGGGLAYAQATVGTLPANQFTYEALAPADAGDGITISHTTAAGPIIVTDGVGTVNITAPAGTTGPVIQAAVLANSTLVQVLLPGTVFDADIGTATTGGLTNSTWTFLTNVAAPPFTDTGLPSGTTFSYVITAVGPAPFNLESGPSFQAFDSTP